MQLTAILVPMVLALSTGAHAWTNGVANDKTEACTIENTDQKLEPGNECSFFVDAEGRIDHGSEYLIPPYLTCTWSDTYWTGRCQTAG